MSEKTKRTESIYSKIPKPMKDALVKDAAANGVSVSTLVFMLLRKHYWTFGE